jgi:hypothetical protein
MDFFLDCDAPDVAYQNVRSAQYPQDAAAKAFVEALWERTAAFLDDDVRSGATHDFLARFWEMYVAASFLERGLPLVPRAERNLRDGGPDLLLGNPRAYVECVTAKAGVGPDAVQPSRPFVVTRVPREQIILRIRNAIDEKLRKYNRYLQKEVLTEGDPYVIAINGAAIPMAQGEPAMPYIVSAVLPFGGQQVHLDAQFEVVGISFEPEWELLKASGTAIRTDVFLDKGHAGISAVIYATVDTGDHGERPGDEFIIVHNPLATNPLPRGVLPGAQEFWVEDEHLQYDPRGG